MDMKILAAVFITLSAVFVVINTGEAQTQDFRTGTSGLSGMISGLFSTPNPQAETQVEADIKVLSPNTTMNVNGDLTVKGLDKYISNNVDIKSNNDIKFKNFDGQIFIGNNTTVTGNVEGFTSNGVQVAKSFRLEKEVNTTQVNVTGAERVSLDFRSADIDLQAKNSSTSLSKSNTTIQIDSFTGNMTVRPQVMELSLIGEINTLRAGSTTIGE